MLANYDKLYFEQNKIQKIRDTENKNNRKYIFLKIENRSNTKHLTSKCTNYKTQKTNTENTKQQDIQIVMWQKYLL